VASQSATAAPDVEDIAMEYDPNHTVGQRRATQLDLDALLHPAKAFAHPMDVVRDSDLTLNEKRAVLASWASDACAVEAAPELRAAADGKVVRWDDIMDALRSLDELAAGQNAPARVRHWKRRRFNAGGASDMGSQAS
jgi:hypothetical protein